MSTKKQLRRERRRKEREQREARAKSRSPTLILIFIAALILIGVAAYFFGRDTPVREGQVWSEEHQHWH